MCPAQTPALRPRGLCAVAPTTPSRHQAPWKEAEPRAGQGKTGEPEASGSAGKGQNAQKTSQRTQKAVATLVWHRDTWASRELLLF